MSLRNKNTALVPTGTPPASLSGTLQRAASSSLIKKPTGAGLSVVQRAMITQDATIGRVGFIIDATASREANWKEAQSIQARMFEKITGVGSLQLRLVHFGGDEITDHGWQTNASEVRSAMAGVECEGGSTQILDGLKIFLADPDVAKTKSIIIVGDSFEEPLADIEPLARELSAKGIKIYAFLDGSEESTAGRAFKTLASTTGGIFSKFGKDMPLDDLCAGVALYSVGGQSALSRLQNAQARQLFLTVKP